MSDAHPAQECSSLSSQKTKLNRLKKKSRSRMRSRKKQNKKGSSCDFKDIVKHRSWLDWGWATNSQNAKGYFRELCSGSIVGIIMLGQFSCLHYNGSAKGLCILDIQRHWRSLIRFNYIL